MNLSNAQLKAMQIVHALRTPDNKRYFVTRHVWHDIHHIHNKTVYWLIEHGLIEQNERESIRLTLKGIEVLTGQKPDKVEYETKGKDAGALMSYLYQWLAQITIEYASSEPDEQLIEQLLSEHFIPLIQELGENGEHHSILRLEVNDNQHFEAELVLRFK